MKRALLIAGLTVVSLGLKPTPALADATAFFGLSPTNATRSASGIGIGIHVVVVGFEFEYGHINQDSATATPGVSSGMFNVLVATPTRTQVYFTVGGGLAHESFNAQGKYTLGTNVGGGVKLPLAGPIRLRVDYRVFKLNGAIPGTSTKTQHRIYAGLNFAF
jgi:hypothetical protein